MSVFGHFFCGDAMFVFFFMPIVAVWHEGVDNPPMSSSSYVSLVLLSWGTRLYYKLNYYLFHP